MDICVNKYSDTHSFTVKGTSYIGEPHSNTAMFVTKKVGHLITALNEVNECLIFAEDGLEVSDELKRIHCFVFSTNPQCDYARFTYDLYVEEELKNSAIKYDCLDNGVYVSNSAVIGNNAYIEPGVVIGPGVIIGDNARIYSGAIVKNAIIGDNVIINEKAVIGASGFTMATDENGNKLRIYSLGKVVVGNNVEIGAQDNISRGSGGDTIIEDYVKIDSLVHIGHDVIIHKNAELTAGTILGGFDEIGEDVFVGLNSSIRNRTKIGSKCVIDMGSVVVRNVEDGTTVFGNPARKMVKPNTEN